LLYSSHRPIDVIIHIIIGCFWFVGIDLTDGPDIVGEFWGI